MARGADTTLKVTVLGDADKLHETFDRAGVSAEGFGSKMMKVAGTVAGAFAAYKVADFVGDSISKASDMQESLSKTMVVFGSAADAATVYGQALSDAQVEAGKAAEKHAEVVASSEGRIADIREDAAEKAADYAERIKDAEEDAAEVSVASYEKVKDAKRDQADVIETQQQRIEDIERAGARSVEDATTAQAKAYEKVADRRKDAADKLIEAEAALAKAQASGAKPDEIERLTQRVNDARESQQRVTRDTAHEIEAADTRLARATEDAARARERAHDEAAEKTEEAARRVEKAEKDGVSAREDAQGRIEELREDAKRSADDAVEKEDEIRAAVAKSRREANEAQEEVARIQASIAKAHAETAAAGGMLNTKWGKEIEKFASDAARNYGLSKRAALDGASQFAIFGKAAGMSGADLVGFSTKFTGLSADMASFHNTKPEQAINAIGAALRGESEPIRAFGVMLNDATIKARAMKMGIYDGTGALTAQQKVLATQAEILAQTTDAQGDFARTSSGLAGQQKILAAEMENATTSIGQKFLPIAKGLVTAGAELMKAWDADGFRGVFKKVQEVWGEVWPGIKEKLGELLTGLGNWIVESGPGILRKLGEWTGAFLNWYYTDLLPKVLSKLGELIGKILSWIGDNREAILNKLGEWTGKFLEWAGSIIGPLLSKLGELLGRMLTWLSDNRQQIFDKLGEWTGAFIDWTGDLLVKILEKLPGITGPIIKWIGDNGPTILLELAKWTGSFLLWIAQMNLEMMGKFATDVLPALLKWIASVAGDILTELGKWGAQFVGWAAQLALDMPGMMVKAATALLKWVADTAPTLLTELGKWSAKFVAWVALAAADLVKEGTAKALDFFAWIGTNAVNLPFELAKWTLQFTMWVGGLASEMVSGMAGLISWIGSQFVNLPGELAKWTGEFVSWVGGLAGAAGDAILSFANKVGQIIVDFIKEHINPANWFGEGGGVGGTSGTGLSKSGKMMRFKDGRWEYADFGTPVPEDDLPEEAKTGGAGVGGRVGASGSAGGGASGSGISGRNSQGGAIFIPPTGATMDPVTGVWTLPGGGVWNPTSAGGDIDDDDWDDEHHDLGKRRPGEDGLSESAIRMRRAVQAGFKGFTSIGGYDPSRPDYSDHKRGKALDIMLPGLHSPIGYQIAAWAKNAASAYKVKYVIWDNEIWNPSVSNSWRDYATSGPVGRKNQSSPTGRHEDHVHISMLGNGALVRGSSGGRLAMLGEAGDDEAVIPLNRSTAATFGAWLLDALFSAWRGRNGWGSSAGGGMGSAPRAPGAGGPTHRSPEVPWVLDNRVVTTPGVFNAAVRLYLEAITGRPVTPPAGPTNATPISNSSAGRVQGAGFNPGVPAPGAVNDPSPYNPNHPTGLWPSSGPTAPQAPVYPAGYNPDHPLGYWPEPKVQVVVHVAGSVLTENDLNNVIRDAVTSRQTVIALRDSMLEAKRQGVAMGLG